MEKYKDVDEYIASFPSDTQQILEQLRAYLLQLVPDAKEKIAYAIPTLTLNGNLVHFAAYKNHIGLYPGSKAIAVFASKLTDYHTAKGTVQFPLGQPLPMQLIKEIVAFCVDQNLRKKKK